MSHLTRIISASAILLSAACGGGGYGTTGPKQPPPPPPPPNGTTVTTNAGVQFSPSTLTVNAGETVTFAFGGAAHNVFFDNPGAATPADIPGNNANRSVERAFATAGTYHYHCTIHPGMVGIVVVL
ncbi:MAG TPA: plastocyanin/azurin family copper-binding protein [Gemmatimonadaceae bacterium]|jgi:plastocyanin|nr:plastocyanin/azurin family copper-binding protein [Gemmatimonadaceae bacterium]